MSTTPEIQIRNLETSPDKVLESETLIINNSLPNSGVLVVTLFVVLLTSTIDHTFALPAIDNITLGEPFFIEHYSNSTVEPQPAGTTFSTTGFGTGILNRTTEVQTEANATITFRDAQTMLLEGRTKYIDNNNNSTASYMFLELGKINPTDQTYSGGGIAIFDEKATGMLSSLSDVVAVYKSIIDINGNATVHYYHWTL